MQVITLILLAISLSIDSFAVSVSCGLLMTNITFWRATRISIPLAFFQAIMPIIGWFIGKKIEKFVSSFDYWIIFGLFAIIGGRMIFESFQKDNEGKKRTNPLDPKVILVMSLATSVDALIVGLSFAFISINLYLITFVIGSTTFIFSMLGILFGKKVGGRLGSRMEIWGGIIIIALGIKILIDHYFN